MDHKKSAYLVRRKWEVSLLFVKLVVLLPKLKLPNIVLKRLSQRENNLIKAKIIPELNEKVVNFSFSKTYPHAPIVRIRSTKCSREKFHYNRKRYKEERRRKKNRIAK